MSDPSTPRLDLLITSPAEMAEWLGNTIGTGPLSGMFRQGTQIVYIPRIGENGYIPPTEEENNIGGPQIWPLTAASLAAHVQFTYSCYKLSRTGIRETAVFPLSAARAVIRAVATQYAPNK